MALRKIDGKYLGKFEHEWQAEKFIDKMCRKYRYHPNPSKYSVSKMQREAANYGIKTTVGFWLYRLRQKNITIRDYPRPKYQAKKRALYTIDKDFLEYLDGFDNKSKLAELGLKIITGWPVREVVMILPPNHDKWSDTVTIVFEETKKGVKAQISGRIEHRDEIMIRSITEKANHLGLEYIIAYCETHGYKYLGGQLIGPTRFWHDVDSIELVDEHDSTIIY